jgi:hypothetical protein
MKHEDEVEELIQAKNLNAPRLSPALIDACIVDETYTITPSLRSLVCELTLVNGFTVRGEASVISVANYDEEVGKKVSREKAKQKIWELEAYLLQQRLYEKQQREGQPAEKTERYFRRLLARQCGILHLYADDGEAYGQEEGIVIDFMRDPAEDIDSKLHALNTARLTRGSNAAKLRAVFDEHIATRAQESRRPPHEQRVLEEKADLDKKIEALKTFISKSPVWETVSPLEKDRLQKQHHTMSHYSTILGERIAAFPSVPAS